MVQDRADRLCLLLAICAYLNLLDLLATLSWCQSWGWLMEINPVMRYFFTIDTLLGGAVKMSAMLLFVIIIQFGARYHFSTAYRGTMLVTLVYSALLGWHLIGPWFKI